MLTAPPMASSCSTKQPFPQQSHSALLEGALAQPQNHNDTKSLHASQETRRLNPRVLNAEGSSTHRSFSSWDYLNLWVFESESRFIWSKHIQVCNHNSYHLMGIDKGNRILLTTVTLRPDFDVRCICQLCVHLHGLQIRPNQAFGACLLEEPATPQQDQKYLRTHHESAQLLVWPMLPLFSR